MTVGGDAPHDIHIHDHGFWSHILRDRELGLGETYMDGGWDANSLVDFLTLVQTADLRSMLTPSPRLLVLVAKSKIMNRQSKARARRNAQAHYNIGNDLYERMLDKRMIYSCAYWADLDSEPTTEGALDAAQESKLDLICRKLKLEAGMTLLDVGCGWGGFAQFAAQRYQVEVTGVSPAEEQVSLARQRCAGLPVRIIEADYRDLSGSYDRITSIGMMEHVGPKNLPTFFDKCRELLDPDGMMLHHTIGSNDWRTSGDPLVRPLHLSRWGASVARPDRQGRPDPLDDRGRPQLRSLLHQDAAGVGPQHLCAMGRDSPLRRVFSANVALLPHEFRGGIPGARHPALASRVHPLETRSADLGARSLSRRTLRTAVLRCCP